MGVKLECGTDQITESIRFEKRLPREAILATSTTCRGKGLQVPRSSALYMEPEHNFTCWDSTSHTEQSL